MDSVFQFVPEPRVLKFGFLTYSELRIDDPIPVACLGTLSGLSDGRDRQILYTKDSDPLEILDSVRRYAERFLTSRDLGNEISFPGMEGNMQTVELELLRVEPYACSLMSIYGVGELFSNADDAADYVKRNHNVKWNSPASWPIESAEVEAVATSLSEFFSASPYCEILDQTSRRE